MAVNPCKECGAPVSDKAESCPQCGAKQKKKTSKLALILAVLVLVVVFTSLLKSGETEVASEPSPEQKAMAIKAQTMRIISEGLKDPDSAKFEFLNENCGTVNSKNSFGGYTGPKRFVAVGDIIELEGHSVSKSEIESLWNKHCK